MYSAWRATGYTTLIYRLLGFEKKLLRQLILNTSSSKVDECVLLCKPSNFWNVRIVSATATAQHLVLYFPVFHLWIYFGIE